MRQGLGCAAGYVKENSKTRRNLIKKSNLKQTTKRKKITFSLEAFDARDVHLVGEFNGWKAGTHPMKNDGNGTWIKRILLPEGQFEYKYIVDNKWVTDPLNKRSCPNCFGTMNNIVKVVV